MKKLLPLLLINLSFISTIQSHSASEPERISFVKNMGQWDHNVLYKAAIGGGSVWLEQGKMSFVFHNQEDMENAHKSRHNKGSLAKENKIHSHAYRLAFINSNIEHGNIPTDKIETIHNYFLGSDPSKWAGNVPLYHEVKYPNIYSNIDLKIYSSDDGYFKYDYIVKPGASIANIQWQYEGIEATIKKGRIILPSHAGEVVEQKPYAYQLINGEKKSVSCNYVLNNGVLSFSFPKGYDNTKELIIDPTLIYSSYTGSNADNWGFTATYDNGGNLYSGGIAFGAGYPTTAGVFDLTFNAGNCDVAITKFNPTGNAIVYSTYLGGNNSESPHSLIVDNTGNLYVMGTTGSANFPTTAGCYDPTFNGGSSVSPNSGYTYTNGSDIFVTKFNATGAALIGSTFVGGTGNDGFNINATLSHNYADEMRGEIVLGPSNEVYVCSSTSSTNFPTTAGALATVAPAGQNGCAFKLSTNLDVLQWSTYIGGTAADAAYSIKPSTNGNVYVTGGTLSNNFPVTAGVVQPGFSGGADGFVIALSNTNGSMAASTYVGTGNYDQSFLLEIDLNDDVYIAGQTKGAYPVTGGVYSNPNSSQFIHKFNPGLTNTVFSTVFGKGATSSTDISLTAFLVDNCQNIYVSGWGGATNTEGSTTGLPTTPGAYDVTTDGSDFYFIVLERNAQSLLYATFFGGSGAEHVDGGTSRFDKRGTIYQAVCAGCGGSNNFPTTPGAWSNTNNSTNCNLGAIKMEFNYLGIDAVANAAPNIIACDPPYDVNFQGTTAGVNHYWDFGDGSPTSNVINPSHTYTGIGNYTVMYVAIDSSTCNIADTAYLSVTILQAETFSANLNVGPYDPCNPTSFDVSLQFTGSGADSLFWNMGNGTTFINDTIVNYTYPTAGTYIISLTAYDFTCGNVGTITDTVSFNSNAITAVANAAPNILACDPPYNVTFTGGTAPQHLWDFGDGTPTSSLQNPSHTFTNIGNYTVMYVVIDSNSCNVTDTAYLSVQILQSEVFSATLNVAPYDPCVLSNFNVSLEFTGSGADSLFWNMGNGVTFIDDTIINYTYPVAGTYIISLTAYDFTCGKVETITDTVIFNPNILTAVANASPNVIRCDPPFNVTFTGSTTPQHYWDFDDGSPIGTTANPTHTFSSIGNYDVMYVAIDSNTCNITDTVFLSVQVLQSEIFSAQFTTVPPQPCKDSVLVSINFTGSGADSLYWNMGNGVTFINDTSVFYYYTTPGIYNLSLTAYDFDCGNTGTISQTIQVDESTIDDKLIVPNVFSPNGDNINEEFRLFFAMYPDINPTQYLKEYTMEIYNRWGKKIFESSTNGWDGKINGKLADDGVYFYIIKFKQECIAEDLATRTGHVTIVR